MFKSLAFGEKNSSSFLRNILCLFIDQAHQQPFFSSLEDCCVKTSKKLPLWLVWSNPDTMADMGDFYYRIMFKNGDGEFRLCRPTICSNVATTIGILL